MKERSSSSNNQSGSQSNLSSTSNAESSVTPPGEQQQQQQQAPPSQQQQQNFLSPYNSINFMTPPIGGTIKCTTCLGNNIQGKVVAYDQQTKMLALSNLLINCSDRCQFEKTKFLSLMIIKKGTPVPNKPGYFDFSMINVAWCSNLEVLEEPTESPEPLTSLNTKKV
jgi:hypothetical protein